MACLRWLGHVCRMNDGRIPKDILYGELASGKRPKGRTKLRFKDACKRDHKETALDVDNWDDHTQDRSLWKQELNQALWSSERKPSSLAEEKRARRRVEAPPLSVTDAAESEIVSIEWVSLATFAAVIKPTV